MSNTKTIQINAAWIAATTVEEAVEFAQNLNLSGDEITNIQAAWVLMEGKGESSCTVSKYGRGADLFECP